MVIPLSKIDSRFVSAGLRAIAPDLVGFGRSDKPAKREGYTYEGHVNWTTRFIQKLDLSGITLVCQDWGGVIGLHVAAEQPERFARIVAANTGLPTGEGPIGDAFMAWRKLLGRSRFSLEMSQTTETTSPSADSCGREA